MRNLKSCIIVYVILTAVTGVIYPLIVTIIAQTAFHDKANGSLLVDHGSVRGSHLIGQKFTRPEYFWPRPSASGYGADPSSASNLGPTSEALKLAIDDRVNYLSLYIAEPIPPDLLLSSGSGLDPDISPDAALAQISHVALARNLSPSQIASLSGLVRQYIETPQWGVFGAPRVNVLRLNLAVDVLFGVPVEGASQN